MQCAALRELLFGLSGYEMFTTGGTCRKSLILFNLPRMEGTMFVMGSASKLRDAVRFLADGTPEKPKTKGAKIDRSEAIPEEPSVKYFTCALPAITCVLVRELQR